MHGKRALDSEPVAPESLFDYVHQTAPDNTIFSIDVGTATSWSARFLPISENQQFVISANLGTMGCALPGAIAAKAASPDRPALQSMVTAPLQWSCKTLPRPLNIISQLLILS